MNKPEKVIYTTKTRRDGASRSSDGRLDVKLSTPGCRVTAILGGPEPSRSGSDDASCSRITWPAHFARAQVQ